MDLAKRQAIMQAVDAAGSERSLVAIRRKDGDLIRIRCDLTCFETYIEATAEDGSSITMAYADIDDINPAEKSQT